MVFFARKQRGEVAHQHNGNGNQRTEQDDLTQIGAQNAGNRQGAGRGRNEHVGGMEAHAHGNGHGGHGDAGVLGKTLGNGAQQNKGGITEHRNGNKVAGDGKAKSGMLLAGDLQNGLGHGFRRAGFFQQRAGHGAQRNDQADVRHGAAHAAGECREHVLHAHAGDQRKGHGGGDQCEEGVNFQFDRAQNQHRHGTN